MQRRLDQVTLETGRLQQTYEIFDLSGMGWQMVTLTTVNFTRDVLSAFATHYPSSFSKAREEGAGPEMDLGGERGGTHIWTSSVGL